MIFSPRRHKHHSISAEADPPPSHSPSHKIKLRFFTTVRGIFLGYCRYKKPFTVPYGTHQTEDETEEGAERTEVPEAGEEEEKRERDLIKDHEEADVRQKRAVKEIVFGKGWEEKESAAKEIMKMASVDAETRKSLAQLGVIPPLVVMSAESDHLRRRLAVQALFELANGSFTNKALMVESGILSKIPSLKSEINALDEPIRLDFARLVQSISSLPNTAQLPLDPSRLLPFVTSVLEESSNSPILDLETKDTCLGSLYNLSTVVENSTLLVTNRVVDILLLNLSSSSSSDKCLATLGNLVVTSSGKRALESHPMIPETLIEIAAQPDKSRCQELSLYILMILAHQSPIARDKMAASGIVPVLLEVGLLGSTLAQKRALRLLQWFKDERNEPSSPRIARDYIGSPLSDREMMNEGKRMIKRMVKQSLHKNMEVITRRANSNSSSSSTDSSELKALIVSSSSKSLPY